jgi:hypothetical protein
MGGDPIGFSVLALCLCALLAGVLCVGAIGDGQITAALGLGGVALVLGGCAYAIFWYLRRIDYWD